MLQHSVYYFECFLLQKECILFWTLSFCIEVTKEWKYDSTKVWKYKSTNVDNDRQWRQYMKGMYMCILFWMLSFTKWMYIILNAFYLYRGYKRTKVQKYKYSNVCLKFHELNSRLQKIKTKNSRNYKNLYILVLV